MWPISQNFFGVIYPPSGVTRVKKHEAKAERVANYIEKSFMKLIIKVNLATVLP